MGAAGRMVMQGPQYTRMEHLMKRYRIGLLAAHSAIDYPRSIRMGVQNTISAPFLRT